jgi:hypothetical protein
MPDGFATFVGAFAVLLAAIFAWKGAKTEATTQIELDSKRLKINQTSLRLAFLSELLGYSRSIIDILSSYNSSSRDDTRQFTLPTLSRPAVFDASIDRIGNLNDGILISSILTFYANLSQIREEHDLRYIRKESPTMNNQAIGKRFRLMAANMSTALTLLSDREPLGFPDEIDPNFIIGANGEIIANHQPCPTSIPQVLRLL